MRSPSDMQELDVVAIEASLEPGRRLRQSVFERHRWLPSEAPLRETGIRFEHEHLAGVRPDSARVADDLGRHAQDLASQLKQLRDRYGAPGAELDGRSGEIGCGRRLHETVDGVADVVHIPSRIDP